MYKVKLTSAIAHEGLIRKKGSVLKVDEPLARDLLRRGKAELFEDQSIDDQGAASEINIEKMSKAQLVALADGLEIKNASAMNKPDLLAAIKKYQEDEQ